MGLNLKERSSGRHEGRLKAVKIWTQIEIRPGEKGSVVVEAVKARVQTMFGQHMGAAETLVREIVLSSTPTKC